MEIENRKNVDYGEHIILQSNYAKSVPYQAKTRIMPRNEWIDQRHIGRLRRMPRKHHSFSQCGWEQRWDMSSNL